MKIKKIQKHSNLQFYIFLKRYFKGFQKELTDVNDNKPVTKYCKKSWDKSNTSWNNINKSLKSIKTTNELFKNIQGPAEYLDRWMINFLRSEESHEGLEWVPRESHNSSEEFLKIWNKAMLITRRERKRN